MDRFILCQYVPLKSSMVFQVMPCGSVPIKGGRFSSHWQCVSFCNMANHMLLLYYIMERNKRMIHLSRYISAPPLQGVFNTIGVKEFFSSGILFCIPLICRISWHINSSVVIDNMSKVLTCILQRYRNTCILKSIQKECTNENYILNHRKLSCTNAA